MMNLNTLHRNFYALFFVLFAIPNCQAQSLDLRNAFNNIKTTFSKYEIQSDGVHRTEWSCFHTKSISVSFKYPHLVVSYFDTYRDGGIQGGIQPGNHKLLIPISGTSFSTFDLWDNRAGLMIENNPEGVEHIYKGKSNALTKTFFYGDGLVIKRLCNQIAKLQELIEEENFRGSLGATSSSTNKKGNKNSSVKSQKTKSGKYVQ